MASNDSKLDETDDDDNIFALCTQENEDIDVTWDWNSPRSKHHTIAIKKKRIRDPAALHSPKLTMKRHHSNNQIPAFDKIKEEMAELRNRVIGSASANNNQNNDVVFDDSVEQELVLCSQQVEAQLERSQKQKQVASEDLADDSFDLVLEQLDDNKIEQLSQSVKKQESSRKPVKIEPESSTIFDAAIVSDGETSPVKCSPEEIEQKRLQALEKLQAKKKQQIIERNRQEALKRLEKNKKKVPRKLNVVIK